MSRLAHSLADDSLVEAHGGLEPDSHEALAPHVRAGWDLVRIYRDHAARVAVWARHLLGPHGDVEDVVQEVFIVVHRRLHEFRGEAKITTWLHEITFRVTQNQRRRMRIARWLDLTPFADSLPVDERTPFDDLEARRACQLAYRALDKLPESERTALVLYEIDGLGAEEIAAITGHTVGSVWMQLSRARQRLRKVFVHLEQTRPFKRGGALR
jgi:RNA polymerase sigma-70 factor (ECF subfamily)